MTSCLTASCSTISLSANNKWVDEQHKGTFPAGSRGEAERHFMGLVLEGKCAPQAPHSVQDTARHHGRTAQAEADGGPVFVFIGD